MKTRGGNRINNKRRLMRLRQKLYDRSSCPDCGGTGTVHARRHWKKYRGCAKCLVSGSVAMISQGDLRWLIEKAEGST